MAESKTVLVTGATGGRAARRSRALAGKGFTIRAMTRHPEGDAAKALAAQRGNGGQGRPRRRAVAPGSAVRGMGRVRGPEHLGGRRRKGRRAGQAPRPARADVRHPALRLQLGRSAHRKTGIPHFENKARVEEVVRGLSFTSHVILRPVFFMENLRDAVVPQRRHDLRRRSIRRRGSR